jgi:cardiolipin synthase A/B
MSVPFVSGNSVRLLRGGSAYFDNLEQSIDTAVDCIHLQTYIFTEDETGQRVADALVRASGRGVKVYLLADGYASDSLSAAFQTRLQEAGISFRFFEPLFRSRQFYLGRRLHHKVVVIDSRIAMVGGINVSNHYNDLPGAPAWLDFAIHVEGPIARDLCELCWKSWRGFPSTKYPAPCSYWSGSPEKEGLAPAAVRMRRNDWVRRKNQISRSYIELLQTARKEVIIVSSYFIPGRILRKNLAAAVSRGIKVKLILAGMSDVRISKNAERFMYDWLLRKGIEIYEYRNTVLHAKLATCDSSWFTVGSYNVNNISAYASVELNLDIQSEECTLHTVSLLQSIIQEHCQPITFEVHQKNRNIFSRFIQWCSYQFFRMIFFLFTFYFKQQN